METIEKQFIKNLNSLKKEIESYTHEDDIWLLKGDIKNTPGNLVLHICGNLKHNIGAVIGKNGFVRNRDAEFSTTGVKKDDLLKEIEQTINIVEPILHG